MVSEPNSQNKNYRPPCITFALVKFQQDEDFEEEARSREEIKKKENENEDKLKLKHTYKGCTL